MKLTVCFKRRDDETGHVSIAVPALCESGLSCDACHDSVNGVEAVAKDAAENFLLELPKSWFHIDPIEDKGLPYYATHEDFSDYMFWCWIDVDVPEVKPLDNDLLEQIKRERISGTANAYRGAKKSACDAVHSHKRMDIGSSSRSVMDYIFLLLAASVASLLVNAVIWGAQ